MLTVVPTAIIHACVGGLLYERTQQHRSPVREPAGVHALSLVICFFSAVLKTDRAHPRMMLSWSINNKKMKETI